ncbi:hypothetical protein E4N72_03940 [Treponema vincentii]|uniref:hypothetical protein n=1 Tax=Treponema vincentii TaxID=69710 RepID=UPI0020A44179|nr:hypothetical protein [Treponema vincentii]UTC45783.1 hypothetical protein E4N72_03940 [Treponema vincentii]
MPKDDPWWDNHFPPNGYRCKCHTRAVSEPRKRRYERDGIKIPPKADGSGGGILRVKTEAPPEEYRTYFNERKGTIERIPKGITPGFNRNQGKMSRNTAVLAECIKKASDKIPEQFNAVTNLNDKHCGKGCAY